MMINRQASTIGKLRNTINRTNSNQGASAPTMNRIVDNTKIAASLRLNAMRCFPISLERQSVVR